MGHVRGLLWFDNVGKLDTRIRRAVTAYEAKHGKRARCILVNATECNVAGMPAGGEQDGVEVVPSNLMVPGNYLVGEICEDAEI